MNLEDNPHLSAITQAWMEYLEYKWEQNDKLILTCKGRFHWNCSRNKSCFSNLKCLFWNCHPVDSSSTTMANIHLTQFLNWKFNFSSISIFFYYQKDFLLLRTEKLSYGIFIWHFLICAVDFAKFLFKTDISENGLSPPTQIPHADIFRDVVAWCSYCHMNA